MNARDLSEPPKTGRPWDAPLRRFITITEGTCTRNKGTAWKGWPQRVFGRVLHKQHASVIGLSSQDIVLSHDFRSVDFCSCESCVHRADASFPLSNRGDFESKMKRAIPHRLRFGNRRKDIKLPFGRPVCSSRRHSLYWERQLSHDEPQFRFQATPGTCRSPLLSGIKWNPGRAGTNRTVRFARGRRFIGKRAHEACRASATPVFAQRFNCRLRLAAASGISALLETWPSG